MRLVFVTQEIDPDSPVLGATVAKVRALAARCDEVVVLTDRAVEGVLPLNCRVHLFASSSRVGRGLRFEQALLRELLRRPRPAAVLAHMCPIYAVLAAPLARPLGVRVLLWFTHWRPSRLLEVAARLSHVVLTVDPSSFPLATPKLRAIGHGIDLARFVPAVRTRREDGALVLAMLGRTSPAKGIETVVRAVAFCPGVRLLVHGPSLTDEERRHRTDLVALVEELRVGDRVTIGEPLLQSQVPELLAAVDGLVNNMRPGAPDKIVFEAAGTALPVLASNPSLDTLLPEELRFARDSPDSLADRIRFLAAADRNAIGADLRGRVERLHSVEGWADAVIGAAR